MSVGESIELSADHRHMQAALAEARAAAEGGEVPVGAVLLLEGEIIGLGRNGTRGEADPTAHAEIVALRNAAKETGAARLPGSTLYVTLEPCLMCLGAMIHARVERLVYGATDPKIGATGFLATVPVAFYGLNHRLKIEGGVLAEECGELLKEFFRARR